MITEADVVRILRDITLYQLGEYPPGLLERELEHFLSEAEDRICQTLWRNGVSCYRSWMEVWVSGERGFNDELWNLEMMARRTGGKVARKLVELMKLSKDIYLAKTLDDKIALVDRVIHAEHGYGKIIDVDIDEARKKAEEEVKKYLKR